jgi:hypothetical protein
MNEIWCVFVYVRNVNILRREKKKTVKAKIIYPQLLLFFFFNRSSARFPQHRSRTLSLFTLKKKLPLPLSI